MERINWEDFRRVDGTLDIVEAFKSIVSSDEVEYQFNYDRAISTLEDIQTLSPITSRQAATLAIIMIAALAGTAERISLVQAGLQRAAVGQTY